MIRDATISDIPNMLAMAERFIALAWGRIGIPFNADTCEALLNALIENPMGVLLVDADCDAMIGVLVHSWHFNSDVLTATELFWWSEPESKAAMDLWKEAERRAGELGALTFNMGAQSHLRADALAKVYQRRGYTPSEQIFITELG